MHSIRVKITAITIVAILTSILSVVIACNYTIQEENQRISAEMMNLIAKDTKNSVEKYLTSIQQSVETVANMATDSLDSVFLIENGVTGTYTRENEQTPEQAEEVAAYLAAYCAEIQELFASISNRTYGAITYYYCINPEVSVLEHGFFYSRVGKTGFYEQEPLDARELDPDDIEHTTWYYTPIQRGRPSWIGPYKAHFLNELLTYSYIVPIYKSGMLIGVLGMDIPFETLTEQVSSIQVYDTGYACLFEPDGTVLYHPELEFGTVMDTAALSVEEDVFLQENNGDELIHYEMNGQKREMAFTTLSNGMKLLITAPESEITASQARLLQAILINAVIIILVFVAILLLVMRYITRPLRQLTVASRKLADGEYDVALDYKGKDEVGTLTVSFSRMRDSLKAYIEDLNRRIYTDDLTGLPNMRYFFGLAEAERDRMAAEGRQPIMLYFNLIGLKFFNRRYGFQEGDKLICAVAEILSRHYGKECVSRFGQDYFAAVTEEAHLEEELQEILRECQEVNDGKTLPVRVGIYPDNLGEVEASRACDRAKYACDLLRNSYDSGYIYFDNNMLQKVQNSRYIINHLNQALAEKWIRVFYQPIVRAANDRICDEEALARWMDPKRGMISPGEFIPVLENARLIYKLDLYVLDRVLEKMNRQRQEGLQVVPHSINLSRVDFDACDIVEEVRRRVDDAGIPREKLTIEVTESTVGSDFDFMKNQIERFQELGFKVWMDDFGSGYSSLDVLQDIHFDLIKFDMRFMKRFGEKKESQIILTELIKMVIGLGIDTVAEGVEAKDQVVFLREVGCTKLQGYYYSKPVPPEEIKDYYRRDGQIKYENLEEEGYYSEIGKINLYDLTAIADSGNENLSNYFDTLPMAVIESDGETMQIVRCNKSYREFMQRAFGDTAPGQHVSLETLQNAPGDPFVKAIGKCREEGARVYIRETLADGSAIHALLRHVAVNPVTGIFACVAVVLGIFDAPDKKETDVSSEKKPAADE